DQRRLRTEIRARLGHPCLPARRGTQKNQVCKQRLRTARSRSIRSTPTGSASAPSTPYRDFDPEPLGSIGSESLAHWRQRKNSLAPAGATPDRFRVGAARLQRQNGLLRSSSILGCARTRWFG